jgi:hypothetical protein
MLPVVVTGVLDTGGDVFPPLLGVDSDESLEPPPPPQADRLAIAAARRAGRNNRWAAFLEKVEVMRVSSDSESNKNYSST